ncbi:MAG: methylenetetrahydrofolate reductase [Clostridia bacterium]|nr:methylenetetrahydrofolate reductase [Clostridia bacterium]
MSEKLNFSLEIFPPKQTDGIEKIYGCLADMSKTLPDFISVTYSAGQAKKGLTTEVCEYLQNTYGIPAVAHLTCAGQTKKSVRDALTEMKSRGIKSILALRGDLTAEKKVSDLVHATDLMEEIIAFGDFDIYGACYPEGHVESPSFDNDISVMKIKNDLGVKEFLSQLFLDNKDFLNMRDKAVKAGVTAPISAGIMPVTSAKQIMRMVQLSGAKIPTKVSKFLSKYENDESALRKVGLEYAIKQIRALEKEGVTSIHLYTMNNYQTAAYVRAGISDLL